ncbi:MAG TPA: hypothetical protein VD735_05305 [Candidatus Saccharimonadales bacterium]|nr:hypothetical protein [Candidatus Saccharimonadales bacterium]
MDEQLARQLTRQLKILNTWLMLLTGVFVISMVIIGVLLFKVVTFVNDTRNRITDVQTKAEDSLNIQKKLCDDDGTAFFQKSSLCD